MINPIGLIQTSSLAAGDLSDVDDPQSTIRYFFLCWGSNKNLLVRQPSQLIDTVCTFKS